MRHVTIISAAGIVLASWVTLSGCADGPVRSAPELEPDQVISRIDGMEFRPSWLKESEPFTIDDGKVTSLGGAEIPVEHRLDAAYRIAQSNAEAAVAGAIEKKLEFIFQNAEEGTDLDSTQVRYIGGEATRLITSAIHPGRRYWEKVAYSTDMGQRLTKYRVFATVEMLESDFKRAIVDAIRRSAGRTGLSAEFAEKVDQQWKELTAAEKRPETAESAQSAPNAPSPAAAANAPSVPSPAATLTNPNGR